MRTSFAEQGLGTDLRATGKPTRNDSSFIPRGNLGQPAAGVRKPDQYGPSFPPVAEQELGEEPHTEVTALPTCYFREKAAEPATEAIGFAMERMERWVGECRGGHSA